VTRNLTLGFYEWASEATRLIDDFEREKMEQMAEIAEKEVNVYWE